MTPETLKDLYLLQLRDAFSAERQLLEVLPTMAGKAHHDVLRTAFWNHLEETRVHIRRLEVMCERMETSPNGQTSHAMKGILKEADDMINYASRVFGKSAPPEVLDAGLIALVQLAEHFEIATYGTLATYADLLEQEDDLDLLMQTLKEEKQTDEMLTRIAKQLVNPAATRPQSTVEALKA